MAHGRGGRSRSGGGMTDALTLDDGQIFILLSHLSRCGGRSRSNGCIRAAADIFRRIGGLAHNSKNCARSHFVAFAYQNIKHLTGSKAFHRQRGFIRLRFTQHVAALNGIANLYIDADDRGLVRRLARRRHLDLRPHGSRHMRRRSRGSCLRCGRLLCGNLCGRGIICFTGFSDDHQYRACRDRITFTYLYRQHGPRRKALHRQNGLIGLRFAQHVTALDGITRLDINGYDAGLIGRLTGTGHFDLSHSILLIRLTSSPVYGPLP